VNVARINWALRVAQDARTALSDLADVMDEIATDVDRDPEASADASHLITRAAEARAAVRLLTRWMKHFRRLQSQAGSGGG
jgi:hypothetical protein